MKDFLSDFIPTWDAELPLGSILAQKGAERNA